MKINFGIKTKIQPPKPTAESGSQTQTANGDLRKKVEKLPKPEIKDPIEELLRKNIKLEEILSPDYAEVDFDYLKINDVYIRTLFVSGYPRTISPGRLDQIINFNASIDISFYIYPIESKGVLDELLRKIAEMEAEISTDIERGKIVDPVTEAKLEDAKALQEELVKGYERFFELGFYITIRAPNLESLNHTTKQLEASLGALLFSSQHATLDMISGFLTTIPEGLDKLNITRNMDTTSLATTFPLTSSELSEDRGVLYGINSQNGSFIIFDRFSLENANMTIFATSGAGKSYFVKLEALRSLMLGTEIIIIDPEGEYRTLSDAVGGQTISFSSSSPSKINPFDLSQILEKGENQLDLKMISLHSLFKVITGQITPVQEALLDNAIVEAYRQKGITRDPETQTKEPPLMEDVYKILVGMETETAIDLAARLEKYVKGSFVGIFDQHTNIEINNPFTVFSIRDLQDALRPIAMFIILDFIWTRIRKNLKQRILVVDEAWHMMRYPDTAQFLWSLVKRARKYFLGITTITQDVEDFLSQDIGKAVVTNSALRLLLKQSPAAIEKIVDIFNLSQGERYLLLGANIGEGVFFAGSNHAPITVISSPQEHKLITTKPQELLEQKVEKNKGITD